MKTAENAAADRSTNVGLHWTDLKSLEQIEEAGRYATAPYPDVTYWEQNWRKGGLSERRIAIIKEYNFYNQQYCGCEFSMRKEEKGG